MLTSELVSLSTHSRISCSMIGSKAPLQAGDRKRQRSMIDHLGKNHRVSSDIVEIGSHCRAAKLHEPG